MVIIKLNTQANILSQPNFNDVILLSYRTQKGIHVGMILYVIISN